MQHPTPSNNADDRRPTTDDRRPTPTPRRFTIYGSHIIRYYYTLHQKKNGARCQARKLAEPLSSCYTAPFCARSFTTNCPRRSPRRRPRPLPVLASWPFCREAFLWPWTSAPPPRPWRPSSPARPGSASAFSRHHRPGILP